MLIFSFFQGADVLAKSLEKQGVRKFLCLLSVFSVRAVMLLQIMLILVFFGFFCSVVRGIPRVLLFNTVIPDFLSGVWAYADTKRY